MRAHTRSKRRSSCLLSTCLSQRQSRNMLACDRTFTSLHAHRVRSSRRWLALVISTRATTHGHRAGPRQPDLPSESQPRGTGTTQGPPLLARGSHRGVVSRVHAPVRGGLSRDRGRGSRLSVDADIERGSPAGRHGRRRRVFGSGSGLRLRTPRAGSAFVCRFKWWRVVRGRCPLAAFSVAGGEVLRTPLS